MRREWIRRRANSQAPRESAAARGSASQRGRTAYDPATLLLSHFLTNLESNIMAVALGLRRPARIPLLLRSQNTRGRITLLIIRVSGRADGRLKLPEHVLGARDKATEPLAEQSDVHVVGDDDGPARVRQTSGGGLDHVVRALPRRRVDGANGAKSLRRGEGSRSSAVEDDGHIVPTKPWRSGHDVQ